MRPALVDNPRPAAVVSDRGGIKWHQVDRTTAAKGVHVATRSLRARCRREGAHVRAGPVPRRDDRERRRAPRADDRARIYVSSAVECELDRHGRILVPASLRKHAGLERDALWAGMGRHVEIWSQERFDALRDKALSDVGTRESIALRLAELGL